MNDEFLASCVAIETPKPYARAPMAWYVCGPMTGIARFNYPMFDIVTNHLRLTNEVVISPTELDSGDMQTMARASKTGNFADIKAAGETWGDILARDVKLIEKNIGHFALLPGWWKSRGARLEVFVGLLVGIESYHSVGFSQDGEILLHQVPIGSIRQMIRENMP